MERKRKVTQAIVALCFALIIGVIMSIPFRILNDAAKMEQAQRIVEAIKAQDKTINAIASTEKSYPAVRVYAVTDRNIQNTIIAWIKGMRDHGKVNRSVTITFFERENMIHTPVTKDGTWGGYRGPEVQIRAVTL